MNTNKVFYRVYYRGKRFGSLAYVWGTASYEKAKGILKSLRLMEDDLHWNHGFQEITHQEGLYFPSVDDFYREIEIPEE